jgi:type IV pilus assembly protein PilB
MAQDNSHISQLSAHGTDEKFSQKLKDIELKQKEDQAQMKAYSLGFTYINLSRKAIPPGILELIPEADAKRYKMVCFLERAGEKHIALADPAIEGIDAYISELEKKHTVKVVRYLISEASFEKALKLYAQLPRIIEEVKGVQITQEDIEKYGTEHVDIRKVNEQVAGASLSEVITIIVVISLKSRSSDIHIEAEEKEVKVRLRIDGVLHEVASLPHESWPKIISRVKLLSSLKINVSDRPQDGRFTISLEKDKVDVRVSTLPTTYGESVVMRLLRSSAASLDFDALGLSPYNYTRLKTEIDKPNGMIITTGPTGSGKTTTLYAILNYLNSPELKIITLEDPVEYKLAGISQSQIDSSKHYTFADGLRSILRQDPDIVMVGEIRDLETAEIAINAALTGHLVISTIHTNSAAGAIPRFLAMGAKGFLLAPALNVVMGQRLLRRLCKECKKEVPLEGELLKRTTDYLSSISPASGITVDMNNIHFWGPVGCDICNGIGFKGRIGIYEIMNMNKDIETLILSEHVSEYSIEEIAIKNGMVKMVQDGLLRALEGVTSVEEVFEAAD